METKQETSSNLIKSEMLKEKILTIHKDKPIPRHFDENCFSDVALDLLYYYRIGAFLVEIINLLPNDISELYHNSIVTGLIKGTGIANLHKKSDGTYGESEASKARYFYQKSMRVYEAYRHFPKSLAQIYFTNKISATKLYKLGSNTIFTKFAKDIESKVINNNEYDYELDDAYELFKDRIFNFKALTENTEIINDVKRYIYNPSMRLKEIEKFNIIEKLKL